MSPWRSASATAEARSWTPSFRKMCSKCVLTVASLNSMCSAIWRRAYPVAESCSAVQNNSLASHVACYKNNGFCQLPVSDQWLLLNTIDPADFQLTEALETGLSFDGPSGKVTLDHATHHVIRNAYLAKAENKTWDVIASYPDQPPSDTAAVCNLITAPATDKQYVIDIKA